MRYFLLVFDRDSGDIRERADFAEGDRERALAARFERERQYQDQPTIEVVVLGASSFEALRNTHGRYFTRDDHRAAQPVALPG
jgi:hypothetical protein